MQTRAIRRLAVVALAGLGACITSAAYMAAEPTDRQTAGAEPQSVSLRLDEFVHTVLSNHPDLETALPASRQSTDTAPGPSARLLVRSASVSDRETEAQLRERVISVLFQAIEAYWEQVRRLGEVQIRQRAVAEAEAMARGVQPETDMDDADLLRGTAETFLAEARIALHLAQQQAEAGEDRLKLLLNDPMLSVESDTRLLLLTEPGESSPVYDLDLTRGIDLAVHNRAISQGDWRDKADRRDYEQMVLEVKTARRRVLSARTMLSLAEHRVGAAERTLEANDDGARQGTTAGVLLIEIRARQALADAERQRLAARVDHEIALAAWDRATGQLDERWGIYVEADR